MNNVVYAKPKPRHKVTIKFVYGQIQPWADADWFLHVDASSSPLAEIYQMLRLPRAICQKQYLDIPGTINIFVNANEKNAQQHSQGKMNGAYVQRSGGYCFKLHSTIKIMTVEVEAGGLYPEDTLREAWPKTDTTVEAMFKKARYPKWPNGEHFYAHLHDGDQVVWDGKMKWDTFEEARTATLAYIEDLVAKQTKQ